MKITFIIPPTYSHEQPAERTAGCTRLVYPMPNIYELIVAAVLEREGYDVKYNDFVLSGKNVSELEQFIKNDDSDWYMMWCVNLSLDTDLKTIESIRKYRSDVKIALMGPGVTYYKNKLLLDSNIFVVRGEPEMSLLELIHTVDDNDDLKMVKGIGFLEDGKPVHTAPRALIEDLDTLPFPARHFIEHYHYTNPKLKIQPYTTLLTSRNCPFHCIYCVPSSLTFAREMEYKTTHATKPPVSFRSVENVIEEIELLADKGYRSISFIDDNFITTVKRLKPICEVLKRHNIQWGCQSRVDAITEEIAAILGNSNCMFVDLGVESFNDDILKYIKKGFTSERIYEGIGLLQKYNVPVKLNILIGTSPLETEETVKDTFRKAQKLGVNQIMFNIVAPFPGTEFYELARKNGWIVGGEYTPTDVQHHSILNFPNLSNKQMERLLFRNNILFFLRPSFIWYNIRRFDSFSDFTTALIALKRKLFH